MFIHNWCKIILAQNSIFLHSEMNRLTVLITCKHTVEKYYMSPTWDTASIQSKYLCFGASGKCVRCKIASFVHRCGKKSKQAPD